MKLALVLGLTLLVSPFLYAADPTPGFTCKANGKVFSCVANNMDSYELLPKWILYSRASEDGIPVFKEKYAAYGLDFHFVAPANWSLIEMRAYPDPDKQTPTPYGSVYEGMEYYQALTWVRTCKVGRADKAVFYPFYKGVNPPSCDKANKK